MLDKTIDATWQYADSFPFKLPPRLADRPHNPSAASEKLADALLHKILDHAAFEGGIALEGRESLPLPRDIAWTFP